MQSSAVELPNMSELAARLSRVEHFRDLTFEEVREVIAAGSLRSYPREGVVFTEGDAGTGLCVLLRGQVQLCKLSTDGQIAILAVFDPVIMFNEVSALDGGPAPATAVAVEPALVWSAAAQALDGILRTHPNIALGLLRVLARRNRHLVSQFEDLSFRSVLSRTAKLLLELSAGGQRAIDRRKHPNHQLAARIATIPEAFSRSLRVFRDSGALQCSYKSIQVLKKEQLYQAAQVGPGSAESLG
jgi:CRP/FNR family transcriptional regulator